MIEKVTKIVKKFLRLQLRGKIILNFDGSGKIRITTELNQESSCKVFEKL